MTYSNGNWGTDRERVGRGESGEKGELTRFPGGLILL